MEILNFIGGQYRPASDNAWLDVVEPASGTRYARLANSDEADVNDAVQAAMEAAEGWKRLHAEDRARYLYTIADLIESRADEFSQAESLDTGKPVSLASNVDIPRAISNFRFFGAAATQFSSESHATGDHAINYTLRQPLGVAACISPWNLPIYLLSWKVAPALATGNTVVAKPSEITPYTASLLCKAASDAGLPRGVLNVLHGEGKRAGAALVRHRDVRAVSFTGSTQTGKAIAASTADQFKKLSLEMGGKNATLVFADCDFDRTVSEVFRSAFSNQGQICLCGSRILVERSIYNEFRDALVEQAKTVRSGDPSLESTRHGALVSEAHFSKVSGYLELAANEGGAILCGGVAKLEGRCRDGRFIDPVLIEGLDQNCRTNQEEIFGPVATLQAFDSPVEAVALANATPYGLACSIWSSNISRCHRLAGQLDCGIVWINCWLQRDLRTPFGGMKASGLGREGGLEAMRFFTEARNVCVEYGHE